MKKKSKDKREKSYCPNLDREGEGESQSHSTFLNFALSIPMHPML